MSSIPSNLARVPNFLATQIMMGSLQGSNQRLLQSQIQLSSGKLVNRPSDNAVAASTIGVLDDILERREQRMRNLDHAEAVLNNQDAALQDANDLVLDAKGIGSSQIGVGSDATTRQNQAQVINSMITELARIGNRQYQDLFLFGGNSTGHAPFGELLAGFQYSGQGTGLTTDIGLSHGIPITSSGDSAFGALSARVQGSLDLDPQMVSDTRLADLGGARGFGITLGSINIDVGGTDITVDLSTAHTIGDAVTQLQTAIQSIDAAATVSIDGTTGNSLAIANNTVAITISDLSTPATAADLGIAATFPIAGGTGSDLNPRLTQQTLITSLTGVTVPLGTIRLTNGGQTRDLDLSTATNIQDIQNAVAGLNIGIRVEIAPAGDRLNFINELSGNSSRGMSIAEVGGSTATELGIRTFDSSTLLADFNDGLGVQIKTGSVDPITGLPDPAADIDFTINLKDGRSFDVDLESVTTVQDVLDQINAAAAGAGITVPAEFTAGLVSTGNGIELTDNTVGTTTSVVARNGSFAAQDLGILGSSSGATLTGDDRATVAVDSVFSHLISLRDALLANDERGITLATGKLDADITRLASARADVGVRTRRITDARSREEELKVQDTGLKSQVQDLDYTEAAIKFASLQQQLQAGLIAASKTSSLSLLDFLT